jgi:hypothetical protein
MEIIIPINTKIKECQYCKELFIYQRKDAKYCSDSCKQFAYQQRKAFKQSLGFFPADDPIIIKRKEGIIRRFLKALW